jgi:hypothetical protein
MAGSFVVGSDTEQAVRLYEVEREYGEDIGIRTAGAVKLEAGPGSRP